MTAVVALAVHLVAGDLFGEEHVVGLVGVERLDDVVAIAPGVGAVDVVLEAGRVGVAGDVEPVPAVALAVVRRRQQRVDQPLPRVGTRVGDEGVDLGRRRRQAEQVEIGAADQRAAIGARRRREPPAGACLLEEAVDGVVEAVTGHRERRLHRRLERPVAAFLVGDRPVFERGHRRRARRGGRRGAGVPAGAVVDPPLQRVDLGGGERLAAHRHRRLFEPGDLPVQPALVGLAGHQRRVRARRRRSPTRASAGRASTAAASRRGSRGTWLRAAGERRWRSPPSGGRLTPPVLARRACPRR